MTELFLSEEAVSRAHEGQKTVRSAFALRAVAHLCDEVVPEHLQVQRQVIQQFEVADDEFLMITDRGIYGDIRDLQQETHEPALTVEQADVAFETDNPVSKFFNAIRHVARLALGVIYRIPHIIRRDF
ncbi:hypothetical protein AN189_03005 [Loktanella sp. 3ANDIMAR09]|uniref:hypothetical protein n=1 Tax=Loktanella sp. 3ANDIMAR09 TaxID=1225657 RepID=UPI0006F6298E|nr:hypothetical protein [Loktanella sp. 3ANDIMAR09]KQI69406.1 hypothetical protein AN189_03005 [Loktanella sp. 3ANDIMAR09]